VVSCDTLGAVTEFRRGILRDVSDCHSHSRIGLGLNSSTDWTGFSTNFTDRIGSICGLDFRKLTDWIGFGGMTVTPCF